MRVSKRGQITIPKALRDRYGLRPGVEVELISTEKGLLIQRRTAAKHPVDQLAGFLDGAGFDVDEYIEEIRGR